jgi:hypothetical protein
MSESGRTVREQAPNRRLSLVRLITKNICNDC